MSAIGFGVSGLAATISAARIPDAVYSLSRFLPRAAGAALLGLVLSSAAIAQEPVAKPSRITTGLVTIESDQQQADQLTGVITATGNVRIVYPDERVVATARQAQYFSQEGRVVLSGDVDIVQEGGNLLRAEQVIYLVDRERMQAIPAQGQQVFSRVVIPPASNTAPAQGRRQR
jgi:lipopolysaccharide export system protein LptA